MSGLKPLRPLLGETYFGPRRSAEERERLAREIANASQQRYSSAAPDESPHPTPDQPGEARG